jgi:hypothetical protein
MPKGYPINGLPLLVETPDGLFDFRLPSHNYDLDLYNFVIKPIPISRYRWSQQYTNDQGFWPNLFSIVDDFLRTCMLLNHDPWEYLVRCSIDGYSVVLFCTVLVENQVDGWSPRVWSPQLFYELPFVQLQTMYASVGQLVPETYESTVGVSMLVRKWNTCVNPPVTPSSSDVAFAASFGEDFTSESEVENAKMYLEYIKPADMFGAKTFFDEPFSLASLLCRYNASHSRYVHKRTQSEYMFSEEGCVLNEFSTNWRRPGSRVEGPSATWPVDHDVEDKIFATLDIKWLIQSQLDADTYTLFSLASVCKSWRRRIQAAAAVIVAEVAEAVSSVLALYEETKLTTKTLKRAQDLLQIAGVDPLVFFAGNCREDLVKSPLLTICVHLRPHRPLGCPTRAYHIMSEEPAHPRVVERYDANPVDELLKWSLQYAKDHRSPPKNLAPRGLYLAHLRQVDPAKRAAIKSRGPLACYDGPLHALRQNCMSAFFYVTLCPETGQRLDWSDTDHLRPRWDPRLAVYLLETAEGEVVRCTAGHHLWK